MKYILKAVLIMLCFPSYCQSNCDSYIKKYDEPSFSYLGLTDPLILGNIIDSENVVITINKLDGNVIYFTFDNMPGCYKKSQKISFITDKADTVSIYNTYRDNCEGVLSFPLSYLHKTQLALEKLKSGKLKGFYLYSEKKLIEFTFERYQALTILEALKCLSK